jgi:hypothetical protein
MMNEIDRVTRWLERVVIGLDLCPFAQAPWRSGRVRIAVSEAATPETAVASLLVEAAALLDSDRVSTTLVVYPHALEEFETFLDAVAAAEDALADADAEGVLQIATFHPDYRFEGASEDDVANFTNRSPYPIMHLLRESEMSDAVDHHPDPEGIPARNVSRLNALGIQRIRALLEEQ